MRANAMTYALDSQNPEYRPPLVLSDLGLCEIDSDDAPLYTLSPAGRAALPDDDEFAFFCPGCLRQLSECSCPIEMV